MAKTPDYSPAVVSQQTGHVVQPVVTLVELDALFLHLLRCPTLLQEARQHLKVEQFDTASEPHYALLWDAMCQMLDKHGEFTFETLSTLVVKHADWGGLSPDQKHAMVRTDKDGILWSCMFCPVTELVPNFARDILQRFLSERYVLNHIRSILLSGGTAGYLKEIEQVLQKTVADLGTIATLQQPPVAAVMPVRGEKLPDPERFTPLELGYIDDHLVGLREGDCNGLLGVYGGGKTTCGIDLAVQAARVFNKAATPEKPGRISIFASYEEPEDKMRFRIWANAAQIRRDKLETLTDWSQLTTQANLEQYERDFQRTTDPQAYIFSETERWDMTRPWLNDCFALLDMSGSGAFPNAGQGYVDELVAACQRICDERKRKRDEGIGMVTVDWAGLMAQRYMQAKNIPKEQLRHVLGEIPDLLRRKIAVPFKCTVWVLHQFNPEQNRRASTARLHHSDAAECRSLAANMACCGCLGVADAQNHAILLNWSKIRYRAIDTMNMPVLKIDPMFGRMLNVSDTLTPDATSRTFVDRATRRAVEGMDLTPAIPVSNGPPGRRAIDIGPAGY